MAAGPLNRSEVKRGCRARVAPDSLGLASWKTKTRGSQAGWGREQPDRPVRLAIQPAS